LYVCDRSSYSPLSLSAERSLPLLLVPFAANHVSRLHLRPCDVLFGTKRRSHAMFMCMIINNIYYKRMPARGKIAGCDVLAMFICMKTLDLKKKVARSQELYGW
jgi:hypothetical protein